MEDHSWEQESDEWLAMAERASDEFFSHLLFLTRRMGVEQASELMRGMYHHQKQYLDGYMAERIAAEIEADATGEDVDEKVAKVLDHFKKKKRFENIVEGTDGPVFSKGSQIQRTIAMGIAVRDPVKGHTYFIVVRPSTGGDPSMVYKIEDAIEQLMHRYIEE
jgi:hypothetical protein